MCTTAIAGELPVECPSCGSTEASLTYSAPVRVLVRDRDVVCVTVCDEASRFTGAALCGICGRRWRLDEEPATGLWHRLGGGAVMAVFRLFAVLWNESGGRCRIFCDGRQRFLFERTQEGVGVEAFSSTDPGRFHRYTYELCARGWSFAWAPRDRKEEIEVGNRDA